MSYATPQPNVSERHGGVPDFKLGKVTFVCWWVNEDHYEWRSTDGRLVVGRNLGKSTCWARVNGMPRGSDYASLRKAMVAAVGADT